MKLELRVNGVLHPIEARADESLLVVLRRELGLASVRETCGIGVCGACTVLVDGLPMSGCLLLAPLAQGREIQTVESLGGDDPMQRAFVETHAFQCGYCTPGMVLAARRLLEENPSPNEEDVRLGLAGNLCRCGSYVKIVEAVLLAAGKESEWTS
ncbi:MAG TPA: (2Fe-2S)-binding protein [Gaiellaceae bacterium]|nr:(2Fe-2S)-binding protein [Gaiellaceae bacterium]